MSRIIQGMFAYSIFLVVLPIGIDFILLRWIDGPLLYFPFVLTGFILYFRFGIKLAMLYLLIFAFFTAYFYISPLSSLNVEDMSDFYILFGLWLLSNIYLLFLEWSRQNFGDHH